MEFFLSLVILSAIFNVNVLGFSMYFCLKTKIIYLFMQRSAKSA